MSRALNVSLAEAAVTETCRKLDIGVSAIEALPSGGTRVVCLTGDGAGILRAKFKKSLIDDRTARSPLFLARRPW